MLRWARPKEIVSTCWFPSGAMCRFGRFRVGRRDGAFPNRPVRKLSRKSSTPNPQFYSEMTRVYNRLTPPQSPKKSEWLTGRQAIDYLRVGTSTFYAYVRAGMIPYRLRKTASGGAKRLYSTQDLDRFAEPQSINRFANN